MNLDRFKQYLQKQNLDENKIDNAMEVLKEFSEFISKQNGSLEKATYNDLHRFSSYLVANKRNSYENYVYLLRYGHFMKNDQLIIAFMEILDGGEVMFNFSNRLKAEFGEKTRNEVFDNPIPPLGLHPSKRPKITKHLVEMYLEKFAEISKLQEGDKLARDSSGVYYRHEKGLYFIQLRRWWTKQGRSHTFNHLDEDFSKLMKFLDKLLNS